MACSIPRLGQSHQLWLGSSLAQPGPQLLYAMMKISSKPPLFASHQPNLTHASCPVHSGIPHHISPCPMSHSCLGDISSHISPCSCQPLSMPATHTAHPAMTSVPYPRCLDHISQLHPHWCLMPLIYVPHAVHIGPSCAPLLTGRPMPYLMSQPHLTAVTSLTSHTSHPHGGPCSSCHAHMPLLHLHCSPVVQSCLRILLPSWSPSILTRAIHVVKLLCTIGRQEQSMHALSWWTSLSSHNHKWMICPWCGPVSLLLTHIHYAHPCTGTASGPSQAHQQNRASTSTFLEVPNQYQ